MDDIELAIPAGVVDSLPADSEDTKRDIQEAVAGWEADINTALQTEDPAGTVVDLVTTEEPRGRMGVGTVHHVAFELADEAAQAAMRERLGEFGMDATGIIDRKYFRAIYAREPGGVLFEFSTPDPGFAVDEEVDSLGRILVLPEWLEDQREEIEASLPPFDYAYDPESAPAED
jgi:glyoxalase family protein